MSVTGSDWVKGITLSVLGSMIGGASKLAIRKSFLMEESILETAGNDTTANYDNPDDPLADDVIKTQRVAQRLRWAAMMGMVTLNPICGVLAMDYASPSITAPFSGLALVWIVAFSKILIGEEASWKQQVAAALIVLGELVVAIFGDHTNDDDETLAELEQSYQEPLFLAFFVGLTLWMCLIAYWINFSASPFVHRFAWGVAGGSITGLVNFLKDALIILKAGEGLPWYFPVLCMLAIGIAFAGLLLLTACMKRYDVTYSSAMFVGSFVVSASIMSAAHYNTFANLSHPINYILYPVGLLLLMGGVWILVHETKAIEEEAIPDTTNDRMIRLVGLNRLKRMRQASRSEMSLEEDYVLFSASSNASAFSFM